MFLEPLEVGAVGLSALNFFGQYYFHYNYNVIQPQNGAYFERQLVQAFGQEISHTKNCKTYTENHLTGRQAV